MIQITAPLQGDKIKELIDGLGEFTFISKAGIKMLFETKIEDKHVAARQAREIIKKQDWGSVLYFQSEAVN